MQSEEANRFYSRFTFSAENQSHYGENEWPQSRRNEHILNLMKLLSISLAITSKFYTERVKFFYDSWKNDGLFWNETRSMEIKERNERERKKENNEERKRGIGEEEKNEFRAKEEPPKELKEEERETGEIDSKIVNRKSRVKTVTLFVELRRSKRGVSSNILRYNHVHWSEFFGKSRVKK